MLQRHEQMLAVELTASACEVRMRISVFFEATWNFSDYAATPKIHAYKIYFCLIIWNYYDIEYIKFNFFYLGLKKKQDQALHIKIKLVNICRYFKFKNWKFLLLEYFFFIQSTYFSYLKKHLFKIFARNFPILKLN